MSNSYLLYLLEASFGVAVFGLTYRLLLARLTYFAGNRSYLVGALLASMLLPLLPLLAGPDLSHWLTPTAKAAVGIGRPFYWQWTGAVAASSAAAPPATFLNIAEILPMLALGIYLLGAGYRLWRLLRDLRWVLRLAHGNPRTRHSGYWLVQVQAQSLPAFSFARFIFLSSAHAALSAADRRLLLLHEQAHVRQYHTADLLLAEVVGVVLWFNPLVKYLKTQLKDVHEYLADRAVTRVSPVSEYGHLLVRLAAQQPPVALVHALASKQIFSRIRTLTQPTSSPMKKLRFLFVVPVVAATWLATSAFNLPAVAPAAALARPATAMPQRASSPIGRISWQGNTVVPAAKLTQALGLKPGDAYDSTMVAKHLNYNPSGDVSSLYLDHGYMFMSIVPVAKRQPNGTVDLAFTVSEGPQVRLRNVTFVGNQKQSAAELARLVSLRSGELFSRAKLIESQQKLAQTGFFNPDKIGINPRPVMGSTGTPNLTDVEFVLVEQK